MTTAVAHLPAPWGDAYFIFTAMTAAVVVICLVVRTMFGATPVDLVRTRCYELPPVRLVIHGVHAGLWIAAAAALCVGLRYGWAYCDVRTGGHGTAACAAAGVGVLFALGAYATYLGLVRIPVNRPPDVSVESVSVTEGIGPSVLEVLGREQFPHMLAYGYRAGVWARAGLAAAGLAAAAIAVAAATEWGDRNGWREAGLAAVYGLRGLIPTPPAAWAGAAAVSAGLGLTLLLFSNRTYTLLRFPAASAAAAGLATATWCCLSAFPVSDASLGLLAGALAAAPAARWIYDLVQASRFAKARGVWDPLESTCRHASLSIL